VVLFERRGGDVRLQRVVSVGQVWQGEGQGKAPFGRWWIPPSIK
jgi:hypothetical protein